MVVNLKNNSHTKLLTVVQTICKFSKIDKKRFIL